LNGASCFLVKLFSERSELKKLELKKLITPRPAFMEPIHFGTFTATKLEEDRERAEERARSASELANLRFQNDLELGRLTAKLEKALASQAATEVMLEGTLLGAQESAALAESERAAAAHVRFALEERAKEAAGRLADALAKAEELRQSGKTAEARLKAAQENLSREKAASKALRAELEDIKALSDAKVSSASRALQVCAHSQAHHHSTRRTATSAWHSAPRSRTPPRVLISWRRSCAW